ncbi:Fic family protein [Halorhodospira neutriphila]|uniref:Cell filamentation protein Fic n=1 Tax=Halorhodospira neutriphila TaxID=168379 RepID=A0ABS1E5Q0_9GAMM|nr:Fic family protein [Halorhodospira neutriphila]MBK1726848.1 cell filamentation protein Fic [Halorhodospira neutriphila]
MAAGTQNRFSGAVTVFHEHRLPERATPAGYAALIDAYGLRVPWPRRLWATSERHKVYSEGGWRLLTPRHAPPATLEGHLTFALKYEGLDLAVLKRLFQAVGPAAVAALVRAKPTGRYARRIWFLYEWLLGAQLPLGDATQGNYVPVVDPALQWTGEGEASPRHRVTNNLPGTPSFCPLVSRTETLDALVGLDLAARARAVIDTVPQGVLSRTAAFLLLKDSRSSYAIEGEHPPQDRIQRWGRAIGEAGQHPLDLDELLRLQRIVIGDARFVELGLRREGGFVGARDHSMRPLPEHVSACPEHLRDLVEGMIAFDRGPAAHIDPVIAAAVLAFGLIYVHPFEDGNGRIHRYLIHHVLAERGFNPPGLVFPVSAVMLEEIDRYRAVLEDYSRRLLPVIDWRATESGNVAVLNNTADFYRFFDATPHAEFLYHCVWRTIERDLPQEAEFLRRYDAFCRRIEQLVDMPERTLDLLFRFLQQNGGRLSKRAREREFAQLSASEVASAERIYGDLFRSDTGY